jgi:preprotein translocase subunit YajC
MKNANLTVGSQFTTAKSGIVGTIQEVKENTTGSFRVRLDVNGQPRWTTVK